MAENPAPASAKASTDPPSIPAFTSMLPRAITAPRRSRGARHCTSALSGTKSKPLNTPTAPMSAIVPQSPGPAGQRPGWSASVRGPPAARARIPPSRPRVGRPPDRSDADADADRRQRETRSASLPDPECAMRKQPRARERGWRSPRRKSGRRSPAEESGRHGSPPSRS